MLTRLTNIVFIIFILTSCGRRGGVEVVVDTNLLVVSNEQQGAIHNHTNLVSWHIANGQFEEAKALLGSVANKDDYTYYLLASVLAKENKLDSALVLVKSALKENPYYLDFLNLEINLLMQTGQYAEAYKQAQRLSLVQKENPSIELATALNFVAEEKPDTAAYLIEQAAKKYTSKQDQLILRKAALQIAQMTNNAEMAITHLEILIHEEPQSQWYFELATCQLKLNRKEEAIQSIAQFTSLDSSENAYLQTIALLLQYNMPFTAQAYLEESNRQIPQSIKLKLHAAEFFDKRYDYSKAKAMYEEVLILHPEHEIATEQLDLVNRKIAYLRLVREREAERQQMQEIVPISPINL